MQKNRAVSDEKKDICTFFKIAQNYPIFFLKKVKVLCKCLDSLLATGI